MKKFFFSHPDVILATIAIVLLVILIGFFSWGINDVVLEIEHGAVPAPSQNQQGFDLQGAEHLDYRGLSTSTSASADNSSSTTNAAATTTVGTEATTASSSVTSTPLRP